MVSIKYISLNTTLKLTNSFFITSGYINLVFFIAFLISRIDTSLRLSNDAKEINDTHKIKFEVQKNKNVVLGKIAPEMKATTEIEINLQKVNGFVDIELEIDDSKLNDVFLLNAKFNDENLSSKSKKKVNAGKIEKVLLELIWKGKDIEDTEIGINISSIEIPVKIKVLQHI